MGVPCEKPSCICTHTDGCNAGWIDVDYWVDSKYKVVDEFAMIEGKRKYEGAIPCQNCDYERWEIWKTSQNSKEYAERLRARSTYNRTKAYESEENSKTRTL